MVGNATTINDDDVIAPGNRGKDIADACNVRGKTVSKTPLPRVR